MVRDTEKHYSSKQGEKAVNNYDVYSTNNGHKPTYDTPDLNLDFLSESGVIDTEAPTKQTNKTLKNIGVVVGLILIGAISFKGVQVFQLNTPSTTKKPAPQEQVTPAPDIPTQIPSNGVYLYEQNQQRIQGALEGTSTEYNRVIFEMASNLVADAKKSKGMSPEEYLLRRGSEIVFKYQTRLIKRDYDFESASGLEEIAVLIPRLQAWYLAYQSVQGATDLDTKFTKSEKVPPAIAGMVADLKVITSEGITLFQAYPESQLIQDRVMDQANQNREEIKELKRQVEELKEPESSGENAP